MLLLSRAAAFITGVTLPVDGGAPFGSDLMPLDTSRPALQFDRLLLAQTPAVLRDPDDPT